VEAMAFSQIAGVKTTFIGLLPAKITGMKGVYIAVKILSVLTAAWGQVRIEQIAPMVAMRPAPKH
jgi:hypothetical protein